MRHMCYICGKIGNIGTLHDDVPVYVCMKHFQYGDTRDKNVYANINLSRGIINMVALKIKNLLS